MTNKNMTSKSEEDFLLAMKHTFNAYNKFGARSNKKLIPIHSWLSKTVEQKLGKSFATSSLGNGGEKKLNGKYYPKNLDISVCKEEKIISTISFKFVTSNYKQNGNNYFENLLGETANIRRVNVGFAHLLVLRNETPYYDKNSGNLKGKEIKKEILNEHDLSKYVKLFMDNDFPHKPDVLGIVVLNIDKKGVCSFADTSHTNFSITTKNALEKELSIEKFLERFVALCNLKG